MSADETYTAREAAEALGVTLPTLYAYVSRGLLRSLDGAAGAKARRYPRADVDALRRKREQRGDPGPVAEAALSWGTPVLPSAITLIADGKLYYRGRDACDLASGHTFEAIANWLWSGEGDATWPAPPEGWPGPAVLQLRAQLPQLDAVAACQALLPVLAANDAAAWDLRPTAVARTGARILTAMAALMAADITSTAQPDGVGGKATAAPEAVAARLAAAWAPDEPDTRAALDAALILAADHELNVSAFTARCAASAQANPYDVVLAGLATLRGARHGGHTERVAALFDAVVTSEQAAQVLGARLRRGESIPGFGQPLYPAGDPRGAALLALAGKVRPASPAVAIGRAIATAGEALLGERPTLDLGLVVLGRALGLPPDAPLALFALGRTAGWLAHAIEQYEAGALIRPRARYTGPAPA